MNTHTEDCGYTVTGHIHNCSCPAGDDLTPEEIVSYLAEVEGTVTIHNGIASLEDGRQLSLLI